MFKYGWSGGRHDFATTQESSTAARVRRLLDSVRRKSKGAPLIMAYRTETGRYRPDLSNVPDMK
jgi:hypothetical protein